MRNKLELRTITISRFLFISMIFTTCLLCFCSLSFFSWKYLSHVVASDVKDCLSPFQGPTMHNESLRMSSLQSQRDKEITWLLAIWEASPQLGIRATNDPFVQHAMRKLRKLRSTKGPHLEDCRARTKEYEKLDKVDQGIKQSLLGKTNLQRMDVGDLQIAPWVEGSNMDNLNMTRSVQHDLWVLQHPANCSDENVRFLVTDWTNLKAHGLGAQLQQMQGMLAIAIEDGRVLVTHDFEFAQHKGCNNSDYNRWSCYFFPETSLECRKRAEELMRDEKAIAQKKVVIMTGTQKEVLWEFNVPSLWGSPWKHTNINVEVNGNMLLNHKKTKYLWWRAQASRYLLRFPSEYTCMLMNKARHEAFGARAAMNTLESYASSKILKEKYTTWMWSMQSKGEQDMEKLVWKKKKPWIPRPLISVHVRIGDKKDEMRLVGFVEYMALAERIRKTFPHVKDIWLSTEMQEVIDETGNYPGWNFYYTKVARQDYNVPMHTYLASLGFETAIGMSVVNLLMAVDSDYFVGAFGSTWCYLINHMRSTSGKLNSGYLSVNHRVMYKW